MATVMVAAEIIADGAIPIMAGWTRSVGLNAEAAGFATMIVMVEVVTATAGVIAIVVGKAARAKALTPFQRRIPMQHADAATEGGARVGSAGAGMTNRARSRHRGRMVPMAVATGATENIASPPRLRRIQCNLPRRVRSLRPKAKRPAQLLHRGKVAMVQFAFQNSKQDCGRAGGMARPLNALEQ